MWFDCACVQFTHESPKAQKYLLGAFEQLCADHEEALVPRVPHILKTFYDCDIVDEEVRKTHHMNTLMYGTVNEPHQDQEALN